MKTMNERERNLSILKMKLDVEDNSAYFVRNPSADNYARLEKSMLEYQEIVKNTKGDGRG